MNRRNIKCIVMMMVVLGVVHGVFAVPREDGTVKLRDRILFRIWISPLRRYFPDPEVRRFVRAIVRGRTDRAWPDRSCRADDRTGYGCRFA